MKRHDLPPEVAERAGNTGIEMPDGTVAWTASQAKTLLDSLGGTKIAILEGEVFGSAPIGLVPLYDGWICPRSPRETATEYAERSRALARGQINKRENGGIFFMLHFSDQRAAA